MERESQDTLEYHAVAVIKKDLPQMTDRALHWLYDEFLGIGPLGTRPNHRPLPHRQPYYALCQSLANEIEKRAILKTKWANGEIGEY